MRYRECTPNPLLQPVIEAIWLLDAHDPASSDHGRILPDGAVELVLSLGGPLRRDSSGDDRELDEAVVIGQLRHVERVVYPRRIRIIAVRFRPAGAAAFIDAAMGDLTGRMESLGDVSRRLQRAVEPLLNARETENSTRMVERLQQVLIGELGRASPRDLIVERACAILARTNGCASIDAVMRDAAIGARQLERRFHRHVGLGPKQLGRAMRFRHAFETARLNPPRNWSAFAHECGFCDQSHMIREFQAFAGAAPTQLCPSHVPATIESQRLASRRTSNDDSMSLLSKTRVNGAMMMKTWATEP